MRTITSLIAINVDKMNDGGKIPIYSNIESIKVADINNDFQYRVNDTVPRIDVVPWFLSSVSRALLSTSDNGVLTAMLTWYALSSFFFYGYKV